MNRLKIYMTILCEKEILLKSLKISIIVGTLLNIINQGDAIFSLNFEDINYIKSLLTYMVPFLVSTYTAISMKLKFKVGETTRIDTTLQCQGCKEVMNIHENEIVPFCKNCKESTKWRMQ